MPAPTFFGTVNGFLDAVGTPSLTSVQDLYLVEHPDRMSTDVESWEEILYVYDTGTTFIKHTVIRHIDGTYSDYAATAPQAEALLVGLMKSDPISCFTLYIEGSVADDLIALWSA